MKELKALERIKNAPTIYVGLASDIYTRYPFECKEIEKALKALAIIKKKGIDWRRFISCNTLEEYNEPIIKFGLFDIKPYTKQEYDLLKEILQ